MTGVWPRIARAAVSVTLGMAVVASAFPADSPGKPAAPAPPRAVNDARPAAGAKPAVGAQAPRPAGIDANTASPELLDGIRGIGPALAARIVQERGRRPFRDMADLQQRVRGIGPANLRKLAADGLNVNGSTAGLDAAGAIGPGASAGGRPVAGSAASGPVIDVNRPVTTPVGRGLLTEKSGDANGRPIATPGDATR